jgi:hypothetical protein
MATRLGLTPVGVVPISTPSSIDVPCLLFQMRFLLPSRVTFVSTVAEVPLQGQSIECLIGRDILSRGLLVYNGTANTFILSF